MRARRMAAPINTARTAVTRPSPTTTTWTTSSRATCTTRAWATATTTASSPEARIPERGCEADAVNEDDRGRGRRVEVIAREHADRRPEHADRDRCDRRARER